ncbi:plastocyanin [Halobacteriales archaeon QS_8_69_26]|nr:MAG: plastocyanin [Halobacteriales archaeon QS_8_69_26]
MSDLRRRELLKLAVTAGAVGALGTARAIRSGDERDGVGQPPREDPEPYDDYRTLVVDGAGDGDYETISAAVEAARPRDLVLVEPGVYEERVQVLDTPRLTIRGRDRNAVVLEGGHERRNGVEVVGVDDVVVENLTARNYEYNGVYWTDVDGYRGSYLTAYNNGEYGLNAYSSVNGRFEHSYASGHPDSGFYVGECDPCHAVVADVLAERNAIGYSGTNAGGALTIEDSEWRHNMAGIVPNTLDAEELAPQSGALIRNNDVHHNANPSAPAKPVAFPAFGTGINVAGGANNRVVGNRVHDHAYFGVLVTPNVDENLWRPANNVVRENDVARSGRADLALGFPAGGGNCFAGNDFDTSRPPAIERRHGCDSSSLLGAIPGDPWPTLVGGKGAVNAEYGDYPAGSYEDQPEPEPRRVMPTPQRPPREAVGDPRGGS